VAGKLSLLIEKKETDLIYEGIATIQIDHLFGGVDRIKKLT